MTTESTLFQRQVSLPTGGTATIRKLNWSQLKAAAKAQTSESLAVMREMGAELIKALRSDKKEDTDEQLERMERMQKAQARKPSQYEVVTVLIDGVVAINGEPATSVEDLHPADAEMLHEAIVGYAWELGSGEKNV